MKLIHAFGACALFTLLASACDDPPRSATPQTKPIADPHETPQETVKPAGTPELSIDSVGPKVGFTRILLDKPEGRQRLSQELGELKARFEGKDAPVSIDRTAKLAWAVAFFEELGKIGATAITVKTNTRKEFSEKLTFTPLDRVKGAPGCSVVAMVLEDRGTAVWKLSGGVASKRSKGFAGPDLTMTGDTIERIGKACKESPTIFLAAAEPIEWGLLYDLGASAKAFQTVKFENVVLLRETPTPGHPVSTE